ncbi:MAG: glycosyltransferase [Pseudomonadota bacterium]
MKQRLADNISLVAQSPGLKHDEVQVAVTIPTFKRPEHLIRTLDTIRAQTTKRNVAIIVMENEAEKREGAEVACPKFDDGTYHGMVVIAHDRGNCNAYNAGWFTAFTQFPNLEFVCVIDDDELADPEWIEAACSTSEKYDAGLVGGPQWPIFEGAPEEKWKTHPVFTPHYTKSGLVPVIYSSGNLTIRRDVLAAMPQPFMDLAFNFTGGGDADFLRRSMAAGFKPAWCNEAIVRETIPENRMTWDWIQKRSLRNGELSARIEHRDRATQKFGRWLTLARTIALLGASPFRTAKNLVKTGSVLSSLYPVHIALGRVMSEFGYKNEQYRNPED